MMMIAVIQRRSMGRDLREARRYGNDIRLCRRKATAPFACRFERRALLDSSATRDRGSLARFPNRSDLAASSDFPVHCKMVATDSGWHLRFQTDRDLSAQASTPPACPRQ